MVTQFFVGPEARKTWRLGLLALLVLALALLVLVPEASSARDALEGNAHEPLNAPDAPTQGCQYGVEFIAAGATGWRFPASQTSQPSGWPSPDDSAWPPDPLAWTTIGFPAIEVDYEITEITNNITYYFTYHFNVTSASDFIKLRFRILRDDGAVVYVNGTEAFRTNMPAGTITHNTLALGEADEGAWYSYYWVPTAGLLQDGDNLLSVEVHQRSTGSSDIHLNLELKADTCEPFGPGPKCYTVADSSNTGKNQYFMDVLVEVDLLAGVGRFIGQANGDNSSMVTWNDEAAEWDPGFRAQESNAVWWATG